MPTTSNFGWTTPADTDLVKDGAAAIRTLGNGIDTSLLDLKGGTTGQVLSKASNTDMDFVWTADASGIPATIVDAKGDLIAATAADTVSRLAVGTDGQVLTADSTAATGLKWAAAASPSYTYTTYSPLIYQNSTSITRNLGAGNSCAYVQIGNFVHGKLGLTVTGTGTANTFVELDMPLASNSGANVMGYGYLVDASASLVYPFVCERNGSTKVVLRATGSTANKYVGETGASFTAALANNDQLFVNWQYEVA